MRGGSGGKEGAEKDRAVSLRFHFLSPESSRVGKRAGGTTTRAEREREATQLRWVRRERKRGRKPLRYVQKEKEEDCGEESTNAIYALAAIFPVNRRYFVKVVDISFPFHAWIEKEVSLSVLGHARSVVVFIFLSPFRLGSDAKGPLHSTLHSPPFHFPQGHQRKKKKRRGVGKASQPVALREEEYVL